MKTPKALKTQIAPANPCITCNGTSFDKLGMLPKQEYAGERDGKPFTAIIRNRRVCKECGQHSVQFLYEGINA